MNFTIICQTCGKPHQTVNKKTRWCSRPCNTAFRWSVEQLRIRFWEKVQRGEGCWIWQGVRSVSRYGTFCFRGHNINAHRAAWLLTHGPIEGKGVDVLHTCHNGHLGCVRPDHLYLGTDLENSRDRVLAGNCSKTVTPEKVREVRRLLGTMTQVEIAKRVGITQAIVCGIKTGKNWSHVQ